MRFGLLLVLLPLLDLVLLFQIGRSLGALPTLLLLVLAGLLGTGLVRTRGLRVLAAAQREVAAGRLPGVAALEGLAVLLGGALLVFPGVLSDLLGLALLFPPTRRALQAPVRRWWERRLREGLRIGVFAPGAGVSSPFPGEPPLDPRHEIVQDDR